MLGQPLKRQDNKNNKLNNEMTNQIFKNTLRTFAFIFFMSAIICCNSNNKAETNDGKTVISENENIPDTVVQFLITSASNDFRNHQPPTPIDFRNVKIGYIKSPNNEWTEFTTIKTSGYEQYLGKTQYCQAATMILSDEKLSIDLKNKFSK